ncbi:MAG: DUF475 domain-containing protein, partial [Patescibacteria group bacterium]
MKLFIAPIVISLLALVAVFYWGGFAALVLALLLSVLEITLSFDNAVVNAKVLNQMSDKWQKRFLTWGILLAVFGTRLVLPVLIVSLAAWISPIGAVFLAFENPAEYGRMLEHAAPAILAFGGAFLMMVSLKYFFDVGKSVHWISLIEKHLVKWGRVEAIELGIALTTILTLSYLGTHYGHGDQGVILAAGIIGIILFIIIQGIASSLHMEGDSVARTGATLFVYLNILDAAFSLDGVVGAFALTSQILVIFVGLGIGAYFVRSITVFLVRKKTLDSLRYLEHGAHWAILGLALSMLIGLVVHVPEWVTGLIGLAFVSLAYISSLQALKK